MGELSKKIGDDGEAIVEGLFRDYLGHFNYRKTKGFECHNQSEHAELRIIKSLTHGVDGLVHYNSPLDEEILEIGFISVKHTSNTYPKNPRSSFKKHFIDIATGLECFKFSEILNEIQKKAKNVKRTRIIGILFWLSSHDDSREQNIIDDLAKSQLESLQIPFDQIIIVDNSCLQFLYRNLERIKLLSNNEYQFVYPSTGLNYRANTNENLGSKMPMEFFTYGLLPLRYTNNDGTVFFIASREGFSEQSLSQIISLAKTFDKLNAVNKILISFPDYKSQEHEDVVFKVKDLFADQDFTRLISITNQEADFRNI